MNKKSATTLKNLLITAVAVNMLVIVMQVYNTASTISAARNSLILLGKSALSTFEGGRRAMMALNPDYAGRFKQYVKYADPDSAVLSIYLFDEKGNAVLNTGDIDPPDVKFNDTGIAETDKGLFIYQKLKPHSMGYGAGMGGGFGRGMGMGMMGMGRGQYGSETYSENHSGNHSDSSKNDTDTYPVLTGAALVDSSTLEHVRNSEMSFLAGVILLEILLVAVFLYSAKLIKAQNEQERQLEMREREAQMGKMSLVMAHELKNPLSSVKGLIEFSAKKSEGSQKDIALRCVDELSRLDRIVNDFLTYGRDMTPEFSDTDIFAIVTDTAKLLEIDASSKGIIIDISGSPVNVKADSAKMKQVFFNLLLNAVQAAPEHTPVTVDILPHKVSITNNVKKGTFDPEKIGTPFYTTKVVGTGLGIAIVKRILGLHGFELEITADKTFMAEVKF